MFIMHLYNPLHSPIKKSAICMTYDLKRLPSTAMVTSLSPIFLRRAAIPAARRRLQRREAASHTQRRMKQSSSEDWLRPSPAQTWRHPWNSPRGSLSTWFKQFWLGRLRIEYNKNWKIVFVFKSEVIKNGPFKGTEAPNLVLITLLSFL